MTTASSGEGLPAESATRVRRLSLVTMGACLSGAALNAGWRLLPGQPRGAAVFGTMLYVAAAVLFFGGLGKEVLRVEGVLPGWLGEMQVLSFATVWLPVNALHEATHAAVALAYGGEVVEVTTPWMVEEDRFGLAFAFPAGVAGWQLAVVSVAPTLAGLALLIGVRGWLLGALDAPPLEATVRILAGAALVRYTWPSREDLAQPVAVVASAFSR